MGTLITIIHVSVAVILILLILLQTIKSEATSFLGGATSANIFGGKGPLSFMTKFTAILAFVFFFTSGYLAFVQTKATKSLIQNTRFPEAMPNAPLGAQKKPNPIPLNNTDNNNSVPSETKAK